MNQPIEPTNQPEEDTARLAVGSDGVEAAWIEAVEQVWDGVGPATYRVTVTLKV